MDQNDRPGAVFQSEFQGYTVKAQAIRPYGRLEGGEPQETLGFAALVKMGPEDIVVIGKTMRAEFHKPGIRVKAAERGKFRANQWVSDGPVEVKAEGGQATLVLTELPEKLDMIRVKFDGEAASRAGELFPAENTGQAKSVFPLKPNCAGTRLWRWESNWREVLNVCSSIEAPHLLQGLGAIAWWKLAPDTKHELVVAGFGQWTKADYATAALANDGSCAVVYLPSPRTITVDLSKLRSPITVSWFDPAKGAFKTANGSPLANGGRGEYTPPDKNGANEPDWALILEALN